MQWNSLFDAAILGLIEGLTEFIPVSSTGHLLISSHFLGFQTEGRTFVVMIQLGAVLAVLAIYAKLLWRLARAAPHDPEARRFFLAIAIAFLPSALVGVLFHDLIKTVLFETPTLIAVMLIIGGIVLILVDRLIPETHQEDALHFSLPFAFKIGLFQTLALVPGVSRSGATIIGAMLMGASKRAAAEFSFLLSVPTMTGAFVFDLWSNWDVIEIAEINEIVVGFVVAFASAALVVKWLLHYLQHHGFALFGWWRIVVGSLTIIALQLGY